MKQDILILSSRIDQTYDALAKHDIAATVVTDIQAVLSELYTHTPAFLWLDLDTSAARSLLVEIMERFIYPPPYIILTSSFSDSTDRASMLNQGADVCIELPVDVSEVLAVLNSVLRREGRLKCVRTGSLLPCIKHRELLIDPLRRKVRMQEQTINLTPKEFELVHFIGAEK